MQADPQTPTIDAADSDSLFGSPPPSSHGGRGRSPSLPVLALPSAAGSAQNVGTLALPGSHFVAEAPVHPSALSRLSDVGTNVFQSHPQRQSALPTRPPTASSSTSILPGRSAVRSPSRAPQPLRKARKGKERATDHSRSSTPRPAPPPIKLPSPDEPLPPNFLRNQQALLGLAGLVSGVNPAQLATQRGSTAQNPIVLDDEDELSSRGFLASQPRSIARNQSSVQSTPTQLPSASGREVLDTLVRQGNILPVVESLVRLLSGSIPPAPPPPPERTGWESSSAPPPKRRKLSRVPAGATDWDIPYPFRDGQGPENYKTEWAQQRARALLADLVNLIHGAARKAAARGYWKDRERERRRTWLDEKDGMVRGYYRPQTAMYGIDVRGGGGVVQDRSAEAETQIASQSAIPSFIEASREAMKQTQGEAATSPRPLSEAQPQILLDQFVSSLLAAPSGQPDQPLVWSNQGVTDLDHFSMQSLSTPSSDTDNSTRPYFDDWMELLNTLPPGDPNEPIDLDGTLSALVSSVADNSNALFADAGMSDAFTLDQNTSFANEGPQLAFGLPAAGADDVIGTMPDFLSDATLFGLSTMPDQNSDTPSGSVPSSLLPATTDIGQGLRGSRNQMQGGETGLVTPDLTSSPRASSADQDPPTPEWSWPFGEPEVANASGPGALSDGDGMGGIAGDVADAIGDDIDRLPILEKGGQTEEMPPVVAEPMGVDAQEPTVLPGGSSGVGTLQQQPLGEGTTSTATTSLNTQPVQGTDAPAELDVFSLAAFLQTQPEGLGQLGNQASTTTPPSYPSPHNPIYSPLQPLSQSSQPTQSYPQTGQATAGSPIPSIISALPSYLSSLHPLSHASSSQPSLSQNPSISTSGANPVTSSLSPHPNPYPALSSLLALASPRLLTQAPPSVAQRALSKHAKTMVLERARGLRDALEKARERARIELWEVSVEGGALVGVGRELEKELGDRQGG